MRISLIDVDAFVDVNNLQEITSPVLFQRGNIPDPNGLVSNEIFGITTRDRKETFAYIDLHGHFLHPVAYKVLKALFGGLDSLIDGSEYYSVKDGKLVKDPNGDTGIEYLYKIWGQLKWDKKEGAASGIRNERVDLISNTKKNVIFMTKLIVIPAFYRDINSSAAGGGETSKLNNFYSAIIRYSNAIKDQGIFEFTFHASMAAVQININKVYNYFKEKLEKKQGMIRKYLMGKSVDNSTRSVITAPTFHANTPGTEIVDFRHCAIPISQCCSLCYPFVVRELKEFFQNEFSNNKYTKQIWDMNKNETIDIVELDHPESYFNDKYIERMINSFIKNPESRFDPILLPTTDGKKRCIAFTGMRPHEAKEEISTIGYRPMTVTDLLYLACCKATSDKHCLVTRYPLLDSFGVFVNEINVLSTTTTIVAQVGDTTYNWYPNVELDTPKEKIGTKFIDSMQFSNSYLKGLDGD